MNEKLVNYLKAARELLSRTYVKFWSTHPDGKGHCAYGALTAVSYELKGGQFYPATELLRAVAIRQHPEFEGQRARRLENGGGSDSFNENPLVYVNNHTDKETTLAVFDAAILKLEMEIAKETPVRAEDLVAVV